MIFMPDDGVYAVAPRKRVHIGGLRAGSAQRMLAVHVLAGAQRRHRDLMMHGGANTDTHHVDLGQRRQHAFHIVVGVRHTELVRSRLGSFRARGADGDGFV